MSKRAHQLQLQIARNLALDRGTGELTDEGIAEFLEHFDQIPKDALDEVLTAGLKLARMIEDDNLTTHHVTVKDHKFHPQQLAAVAPCRIIITCQGSPKSDGHCLEVYRSYPEQLVAESETLRGGSSFTCRLLDAGEYRITDQVYRFMTATIDVAAPAVAGATAPTGDRLNTSASEAPPSQPSDQQQQPTGVLGAALNSIPLKRLGTADGAEDALPLDSDQASAPAAQLVSAECSASALIPSYRPSEEGTLQLLRSSAASAPGLTATGWSTQSTGTSSSAAGSSPEPQAHEGQSRQDVGSSSTSPITATTQPPQHFACGLDMLVFDAAAVPAVPAAEHSTSSLLHPGGTTQQQLHARRQVTPSPAWNVNQRTRWSSQLGSDTASIASEESDGALHPGRIHVIVSSAAHAAAGSLHQGSSLAAGLPPADGSFVLGTCGSLGGSSGACLAASPCSSSSSPCRSDSAFQYVPLASDDMDDPGAGAGTPSSSSSAAQGRPQGVAPSSPLPSPTFTPGSAPSDPRHARGRHRGQRSSTPRGASWVSSQRRSSAARSGSGSPVAGSGEDTGEEASPRVERGSLSPSHMPMEVDGPDSSWQQACTQTLRPNVLGGHGPLPAGHSLVLQGGVYRRRVQQQQQGTQTEEALDRTPLTTATGALRPGTHIVSGSRGLQQHQHQLRHGDSTVQQQGQRSQHSVVTEELLQQDLGQQPQPLQQRLRPRSGWQLQQASGEQQQRHYLQLKQKKLQVDGRDGSSYSSSGGRPYTSSYSSIHMQDVSEGELEGANPEDRLQLPMRLAKLQDRSAAAGRHAALQEHVAARTNTISSGGLGSGTWEVGSAAPTSHRRQVSISATATAMPAAELEGDGRGAGSSSSSLGPTRAMLEARGLAAGREGSVGAAASSSSSGRDRESSKATTRISPRSRFKQQAVLQAKLERPPSEEDLTGSLLEVKCPRCKKGYYSPFNLWRCKHIHATSQGGSRHKVHHEEIKAYLRTLAPTEQANLLDLTQRPEAKVLLHAAYQQQQDQELEQQCQTTEGMRVICRRTLLLLQMVQGWEAAERQGFTQEAGWPDVEGTLRLLEDASEGAFMDPQISSCRLVLPEPGHSSSSSTASGGHWRYEVRDLCDPLNTAAGLAFLVEQNIAEARYKARELEAQRIASELLSFEEAATATKGKSAGSSGPGRKQPLANTAGASSRSSKKRQGAAAAGASTAAPPADEDASQQQEEAAPPAAAGGGDVQQAAASAGADLDGEGSEQAAAQAPEASVAMPVPVPEQEHSGSKAAALKQTAPQKKGAAAVAAGQPSGHGTAGGHSRHSSTASEAGAGPQAASQRAGRAAPLAQQQVAGVGPAAPEGVVPALEGLKQQGRVAAPGSRGSSRRSSNASTSSHASDGDGWSAAGSAPPVDPTAAAQKGPRPPSRLRSSSTTLGEAAHRQARGATAAVDREMPGKGSKAASGAATVANAPGAPAASAGKLLAKDHKQAQAQRGPPVHQQQPKPQADKQQPLPSRQPPPLPQHQQQQQVRPKGQSSAQHAGAGAGPAAPGNQAALRQKPAGGQGPWGGSASSLKQQRQPLVASNEAAAAASHGQGGAWSSAGGTAGAGTPAAAAATAAAKGRPQPSAGGASVANKAGAEVVATSDSGGGHAGAAGAAAAEGGAPSAVSHTEAGAVHSAAAWPVQAGSSAAGAPAQQAPAATPPQAAAQPDHVAVEFTGAPVPHEQQQQQMHPVEQGAPGMYAGMPPPPAVQYQMMMQQWYMEMYAHQWHLHQQQLMHQQQQQQGVPPPQQQQEAAAGGVDSTHLVQAAEAAPAAGHQQQQQQPAVPSKPSKAEQLRPPPIACSSPAPHSDMSSSRSSTGPTPTSITGPSHTLPELATHHAADSSQPPPVGMDPGLHAVPGPMPVPSAPPMDPAAAAYWHAHQQHMAWLYQQQLYHQQLQQQQQAQVPPPGVGHPEGSTSTPQQPQPQPAVSLRFGDVPDALFSETESDTPSSRPAASVSPALQQPQYAPLQRQDYPGAPPPAVCAGQQGAVLGAAEAGPSTSADSRAPEAAPEFQQPRGFLQLLQRALGPQGLAQARRLSAAGACSPAAAPQRVRQHDAAAAARELEQRWAASENRPQAAACAPVTSQQASAGWGNPDHAAASTAAAAAPAVRGQGSSSPPAAAAAGGASSTGSRHSMTHGWGGAHSTAAAGQRMGQPPPPPSGSAPWQPRQQQRLHVLGTRPGSGGSRPTPSAWGTASAAPAGDGRAATGGPVARATSGYGPQSRGSPTGQHAAAASRGWPIAAAAGGTGSSWGPTGLPAGRAGPAAWQTGAGGLGSRGTQQGGAVSGNLPGSLQHWPALGSGKGRQ